MMRLLFGLVVFLSVVQLSAQDRRNTTPFEKVRERNFSDGKIEIRQAAGIEQLLNHHIQNNRANPGVEGFRIQLYSGTGAQSRQEAQEVRTRLLSLFPDEKVVVEYNAPFWRVRVGSYRHKHEALPLLRRVRAPFPNSYIVRDPAIRPEEFR